MEGKKGQRLSPPLPNHNNHLQGDTKRENQKNTGKFSSLPTYERENSHLEDSSCHRHRHLTSPPPPAIFCHETWSLIDVIHKACNLAHSYQLSSDMMLNSLPQFSTSSCNQGDLRWNAPVHDPRDHTATKVDGGGLDGAQGCRHFGRRRWRNGLMVVVFDLVAWGQSKIVMVVGNSGARELGDKGEGEIDYERALHAEAAARGKAISKRFHVICFEDIRPYTGWLHRNDSKASIANGVTPEGFIGYAVNMNQKVLPQEIEEILAQIEGKKSDLRMIEERNKGLEQDRAKYIKKFNKKKETYEKFTDRMKPMTELLLYF
ncbi:hypothetical protein JHK85_012133 [Glycine max]|nr:hypothetical protein JHK85_012133 [Glycine max]